MGRPVVADVKQVFSDKPTALGPASAWVGRLSGGRRFGVLHMSSRLSVTVEGGQCLMLERNEDLDLTLFGMMQATDEVLDWSSVKGGA
jgi:hypothetical protein